MYDNYSKEKLINIIINLSIENNNLKELIEKKIYNKKNILFSDFIVSCLNIHKNKISKPTYDGYSNVIYNHVVPYFIEKNIYIDKLSVIDLENYYWYKIESGLSNNTIKKHHANISTTVFLKLHHPYSFLINSLLF